MIFVRFAITQDDGTKKPSVWSLVPKVDSFTLTKSGIILWEQGQLKSILDCDNVMEISDHHEILTKTKFKLKSPDGDQEITYEKWIHAEARDTLGRPIP